MNIFKKAFLISVGLVTIAYDEAAKRLEKVLKTVEEQRQKVFTKQEA